MIWIVTGCSSDTVEDMGRAFPDGFLWGSAVAGFQSEMGCPTWSADECNDTASDWYQWVTDPQITENNSLAVSGESVDNGPGMWETFEDDVTLMQSDGHSAFRLSIEWSRLFPESAEHIDSVEGLDAVVDTTAVQRYHEMLDALRGAGISPLVTINHYVLPLWVHDGVACNTDPETCQASGWMDGERIVPLITLYSGWLAREFGDSVDRWATLNEPFATTLSGYVMPGEERSSPPGLLFHGPGTVASALNQIEASAAMYEAVHQWDGGDVDGDGVTAEVGLVLNMVAIEPNDPDSPADVEAVSHMDYVYHRLFLDALTEGTWDDDLDGVPDRTRDELSGTLDYIGINYYNRVKVIGWGVTMLDEVPIFDFFPKMSWEIYPQGLAQVVQTASEYGLPMWITENGTGDVAQSPSALEGHLSELQGTIADGADVRGYFYWTFVDNYEWNHGMSWKMGLYELDIKTKARIRRPVAEYYAEVIGGNALPD